MRPARRAESLRLPNPASLVASTPRPAPRAQLPQNAGYFAEHQDDLRLIAAVSGYLGVTLLPRELTLPDGVRVGVHGLDDEGTTLVQCIAFHGQIKSTHRNMALAAAFRLIWLRSVYYPSARIALALSEQLKSLLVPGAWLPLALTDLGVEILVVADDGAVTSALS